MTETPLRRMIRLGDIDYASSWRDMYQQDVSGFATYLLLHPNHMSALPLILTNGMKIISGNRMVAAVRSNDANPQQFLSAYVVDSITELTQVLANDPGAGPLAPGGTSLTIEEKLRLGMLIEEMEQPHTDMRRQKARSKGGKISAARNRNTHSNNSPTIPTTHSASTSIRDTVGKVIGMAGPTYQRGRDVLRAGTMRNPTEQAQAALTCLRETGHIFPAWEQLIGRRPLGLVTASADRIVDPKRQRKILEQTGQTLSGITHVLSDLGPLDASLAIEELAEYEKTFRAARQILERTIRTLKEHTRA